MKYGVKFLLTYGQIVVAVGMTEHESREVVRRWSTGDYAIKGTTHLHHDRYEWSVKLDQVVAIHLVAVPDQPTGQLPPAPPLSGFLRN